MSGVADWLKQKRERGWQSYQQLDGVRVSTSRVCRTHFETANWQGTAVARVRVEGSLPCLVGALELLVVLNEVLKGRYDNETPFIHTLVQVGQHCTYAESEREAGACQPHAHGNGGVHSDEDTRQT